MAGITANSATATMVEGDTSEDNAVSGYIVGEQIVLATFPAGTSTAWGIARPGTSTSRSNLNAADIAAPVFTPDAGGYYTLTADVDGASYVLRIAVADVAVTTLAGAMRLVPLADEQVPTPPTGLAAYYSSTQSALATKDSSGAVSEVITAPPTWAAYDVAFSAEGGTPDIGSGSVSAFWRKVGDSIEFDVFASFGGSTDFGAGALLFDVLSAIPGGYTFDTTKLLASLFIRGECRFSDTSPASNGALGYLVANGTTQIKLATLARADVTATAPFTWVAGDYIVLRGSVPVQVV
jgi:hypothetical protein